MQEPLAARAPGWKSALDSCTMLQSRVLNSCFSFVVFPVVADFGKRPKAVPLARVREQLCNLAKARVFQAAKDVAEVDNPADADVEVRSLIWLVLVGFMSVCVFLVSVSGVAASRAVSL
jgi:hypothetical protein